MGLLSNYLRRTVKGTQQVPKIALIGIALAGMILAAVACGQEAQTPVKATWVNPQIVGDSVSVPVNEINNNKMVHFNVPVTAGGKLAFMAYEFDGKLNVRANVCPPCRSVGFSLSKDTLICDSCRTTFKAKTGEGVSGACVDYPKAAVPYEISDGKLVMKGDDLLVAYQNTNEAGLP